MRCEHCVTTSYYLASKSLSKTRAGESVDWLLEHFNVLAETGDVFVRARKLPMRDYEDAVVTSVVDLNDCDYIITRNLGDFRNSPVEALMPEEFIVVLEDLN